MKLSDVRDYIASLKIANEVYMSKMPDKKERSIGVYNSKHMYAYHTAIGGDAQKSHGMKYITLLVHWNRSPRDTEAAANELFECVKKAREVKINEETIKFIQPLYELQDVGTDDAGIYEMVLEVAFVFKKGR